MTENTMFNKEFFDTHQAIKEIIAVGNGSGMNEAQAEIVIRYVDFSRSKHQEELAKKEDVESTRHLLQADIDQTRTALQADINQTRTDLQADIDQTRTALQADIDQTRTALQADIEQNKNLLEAKIDQTKAELQAEISRKFAQMIIWIAGLLVANSSITIALLKIL